MSQIQRIDNSPLDIWKARLHTIEEACPWPGPRPLIPDLDGEKRWRMTGRLKEIKSFLAKLQQHSFLILHGVSGVGKSSMLQIGLQPAMISTGFEPIICYRWNVDSGSDADIESSMREVIKANMKDDPRLPKLIELMESNSVAESLAKFTDRKTVLVLDQFEEYIRSHEQSFMPMANWLESINKSQKNLRIVLSLRSEFQYVIDDNLFSQSRLLAFSFDSIKLAAMEDNESIKTVIDPSRNQQFKQKYAGYIPIEDAAANDIFTEWSSGSYGASSKSLLGLQAVLYALYWIANEESNPESTEKSATISTEHINRLREDYRDATDGDLFLAGFFYTINQKFKHCEKAAEASPIISEIVTPMARLHLYRAIPLMTLGGYKVVQDLQKLCENLFKDELKLMHMLSTEFVGFVFSRLQNAALGLTETGDSSSDLINLSRDKIIADFHDIQDTEVDEDNRSLTEEEREILSEGQLDSIPWKSDRFDITSGAMMGMPPEEVLVELLRIFWFAIIWLDESKICRVLKGEKSSITIVHDKLGEALIKWRDEWQDEPAVQIASIVETVGLNLDWKGPQWREFGTAETSRETEFLVNLRWRSCNVQEAKFRNLLFVNCDFRSTRFDRCVFEGAIFVNCLLDGAMFDNCKVIGDVDWDSQDLHGLDDNILIQDSLPAFSIQVDEEDVKPLEYYRGEQSIVDAERFSGNTASASNTDNTRQYWVYSAASGVAARSSTGKIIGVAAEVPKPTGGLILLGGRVSTLMFRGCEFSSADNQDGSIAFVFVAGSSLEFVEQDEIDIKIIWSALRGLTITRPIDRSEVKAEETQEADINSTSATKEFMISAEQSMLSNIWLGGGLRGCAEFHDCTVYALTSLSTPPYPDHAGFEVIVGADNNQGFVYNTERWVDESEESNSMTDDNAVLGSNSGSLQLAPNALFSKTTQGKLRSIATKADYRSVAARTELLRRVAEKE